MTRDEDLCIIELEQEVERLRDVLAQLIREVSWAGNAALSRLKAETLLRRLEDAE